ncbi:MAG: hypothetical protein JXR94_13435 [Candidatus Hydrogenedentes bacterium]|nr:hypothetical protein [Candidatus Hydrogenedentota bacterium]
MRRFLIKLALFCALNAAAAAAFMLILDGRRDAPPCGTNSMLFRIPRDSHREIVVLGSSHGLILSFYEESQAALRDGLGCEPLNLSKIAAGVVPEKCYLSYYFARGNSADTLVYIIDPWLFHSRIWNEDNVFLMDEPFRPGFLAVAIENRVSLRRIAAHIPARFSPKWVVKGPHHEIRWPRFSGVVDPDSVRNRLAVLYPDGTSDALFKRYAAVLEELIADANARGTRVVLVCPPTLLGPLPGHDEMAALLRSYEGRHDATFVDLSTAITDPALYRDHDHLNARGVGVLARDYLRPVLAGTAAPRPARKPRKPPGRGV